MVPGLIVTETGVSRAFVEASKVRDFTLKVLSSAVTIAAPPVRLSAMNFTSEPGPGVEVAAVSPFLSVFAQLPSTVQSSVAPPAVQ